MTAQPNVADLDRLAALDKHDGTDVRPALLRLMTDFYVQRPVHSEEQTKRYTDLALLLIDHVDMKTRSAVAAALSIHAAPPPLVMQRLLRDAIDTTLAHPVSAPFAGTKAAAEELSELFFAANAAERRLILINLPFAPFTPVEQPLASPASDMVHRLEKAALDHNHESFARELESALGISREQARRLIDDEWGEPILVAAKALAMPAAVLQRILLCLNPAVSRSVQRVYDLAWLYEEIELDAALRLIAIWRASRKAEPASEGVQNAPAVRAAAPEDWYVEARVRPTLPPRRKIEWDEHAKQRAAESA